MATLSESESRRLYSWWWDSHISPKNSKWLQENLTDMDSKIKAMIKLIEEDADSFARRAEMYYKKRPELMKLVEEFYRAYRALAERYDYITGELRHAHRTMAEAFPNHQPPFSMPDDSPTVRRPHTPDPEADISKKTLEKLRELFGSGENPDFFPGKENLDSGEVEKLKKALNDAETEKEAVRVRYQERVEKLCNVEEELNRAKTDCFKLKVQASEAENEISILKEALSKLEAEKEVGFLNLEKKIAVTEEEARLLKNRADTAETEVKKLEESLKKLKEEKEDCLEKISKLEKEIFSARDELKRLQNEMLMGKSKLKSVEEKCVVLEISNRSLRLEAENLIKKIAFKDQELAEKHSELERFNIQVQEERSRYVQVEENLRNLENLQSRSTVELRNGLRLLKEMEISKHGLEEELHRVKDENWSLNESNSSSSISIRNLESEIVSLRKMKEKLKEELAVQFQEIFRLKEEIKSLNTSYNDLMEQVKSLGLNPDSFGSSVKDLQEENLKLKRTCEHERDEKEVIFKKIEDMEEKFGGTLVQEKAFLLSQLQVITNNMQSLLERNNFLEDSLSGAKIEITALREKSKKLEELSRVLDDEKSNLVKERSGLVIQLENVEQRLGNLEEKFAEFEGKYMGLEKEKESMQSQVEELKVCLGAEKEERESLTLWSETRLASLQNHVDVLEEESRWRQIEFQEELDKVVISEFEIFILQKFIQEMEEKNSSVLTEFQKLVEESKFSEKLIEELEIENLEQQVESELLLVEIEKLRLIIYQVFKALDTCANIGSEEKIGKKEESLVHFILGDIEKTKRLLTKYEEDLEKLLVEKSVILTVLGQMQNENEEVVEMNRLLRTEIRRRDQWSRLLEAEAESLRLKQGDVQKAYVELEEENRSLLGKFVELMEEKRLLEEENDAITLETFSLGTISTFFKSFATENAFELKLLWEDLQNTRSVKNTIETENSFLKDSIHRLEIELFRVNDFNIGLCKTVEGLKREYEESKLMRENSELQIIKQQKEIQFLREEIEERRMREEKLTMELRERTNEFEIWEAEAEKFYFDLQNSVFREVLFEDKAKELALVCERLEDESFSKARDIEVVKGRVDLKESEIGGLKAQLVAYAPFVVSMRENLASLQHNTLSLTKLIAADNRKSKDKETAADLHEESHQEVMEEHNCPLPSGILELKHLQQQIKAVEKVVVEQKKRLAMREIKEMKSNCSPVRVKVDQNEETVLWDKLALDDLKLRRVKSKKLEPKNGVLMKDIPLDEICTRRSSKADYQTRESTENDTAYHQSLELQIEKELRVDNLQVQESAKKGKILQRLASNSQRLSSLQTNIQELKTKLAVNKKGKRGKGLDFDKLEEQLREVEASVAQMMGLNGLLKKDTEESRSSSDEDSSRIYEEAQTGFERIVRLQLEVEKIGCMMTKMEVDKKSKWKISLSRMKSRSKIVVRSLIYLGRMRRSSSGRRKKGCFSGCFRSSRNGELNHM